MQRHDTGLVDLLIRFCCVGEGSVPEFDITDPEFTSMRRFFTFMQFFCFFEFHNPLLIGRAKNICLAMSKMDPWKAHMYATSIPWADGMQVTAKSCLPYRLDSDVLDRLSIQRSSHAYLRIDEYIRFLGFQSSCGELIMRRTIYDRGAMGCNMYRWHWLPQKTCLDMFRCAESCPVGSTQPAEAVEVLVDGTHMVPSWFLRILDRVFKELAVLPSEAIVEDPELLAFIAHMAWEQCSRCAEKIIDDWLWMTPYLVAEIKMVREQVSSHRHSPVRDSLTNHDISRSVF